MILILIWLSIPLTTTCVSPLCRAKVAYLSDNPVPIFLFLNIKSQHGPVNIHTGEDEKQIIIFIKFYLLHSLQDASRAITKLIILKEPLGALGLLLSWLAGPYASTHLVRLSDIYIYIFFFLLPTFQCATLKRWKSACMKC